MKSKHIVLLSYVRRSASVTGVRALLAASSLVALLLSAGAGGHWN